MQNLMNKLCKININNRCLILLIKNISNLNVKMIDFFILIIKCFMVFK